MEGFYSHKYKRSPRLYSVEVFHFLARALEQGPPSRTLGPIVRGPGRQENPLGRDMATCNQAAGGALM